MYADESRPGWSALDDIEVLASVRADSSLPDNFTSDNPKVSVFRKNYYDAKYKLRSQWDDQFRQTRIYVLDPKAIYAAEIVGDDYMRILQDSGAVAAKKLLDKEIAWKTMCMNPHVWMSTLDLQHQGMSYGLPDFEESRESLIEQYRWANSKQVNARRMVLRSQALNHDLLAFNPITLRTDGSFSGTWQSAPIRIVASSLAAKLTYDSGFTRDLAALFTGQQRKEKLLRHTVPLFASPKAKESLVREAFSKDTEQIQLAGIAAGHAFQLYANPVERHLLVATFECVYVNGRLLD